jgi:hypothetical protein
MTPQLPMFSRKLFYFLTGGLIVCLLLGISLFPKNTPVALAKEQQSVLIEATIADIESAYESRNLENMTDLLDKDYNDRLEFKSSLEDYFLSVKELQIHFVIDSSLSEGDKINVHLHWFKKSVNNSGGFSKSQGSSQLTFKNTGEGLKLFYIHQDNPFY